MSKNHNKNALFVDTGFLRDHVSKLREERKLAKRLYDNVAAMKRAGDPAVAYQYDPILRDINKLIEYFSRMAALLADVDDDAVQLSNEIKSLLEEDAAHTRRVTSDTFML